MNTTSTLTTKVKSHDNHPHEPSQSLDEFLSERAKERQAKRRTIIQDYFPPIETMSEPVYYGLQSWTLVDSCVRWVKPSAVINIGNGVQTGSEIARDYLDWKFQRRLRATASQVQALKVHRSSPLYCEPQVLEYGAYVDLKAAFWSIMCLAGWDTDYFPGRWLTQGTIPDDFPLSEHKVARNCLVSLGLPTPVKFWTGQRKVRQYRRNIHINLGLWAAIMDTLHAIGSIARSMGAAYIHTDGYILEMWQAGELIEEIERFGLHASVKASGVSVVVGLGNYKVGDKVTKSYMKGNAVFGAVDNLYRVNNDHLRNKLSHFAHSNAVMLRRQENQEVRE